MVKVKEEIKHCYLLKLSSNTSFRIDEDELPKVIKGINDGNVVILRQGIFNPSYFVAVIKDIQRELSLVEDRETMRWSIEQGYTEEPKLKPLEDIFEKVRDKLLKAPKQK